MLNIFVRQFKWRIQNAFTIVMSIVQPMLWLVLYGGIAGSAMTDLGNYVAFILPGVAVLVLSSCSGFSASVNYIAKENGSLNRIWISPIKRSSVVLGQMLESVCLSFFEVGILFLTSLLFSVRISSGLLGALLAVLILFLSAFFLSGLTYCCSLIIPQMEVFQTMMNALVLPLFFVSPALFPVGQEGGVLGVVVNLNPFTHIINALRGLVLSSVIDWNQILFTTVLLAVLSMLAYVLALSSFQNLPRKLG